MDKPVGPDGEQSHRVARDRAFRRYSHINKQLLQELYYTQGYSTSVALVSALMAIGIPLGKKSGTEPFLSFSTDRLTWNFIRGVFDADGHIRVYERTGYVNGIKYGPYRRAKWSITCGVPFVSGLRDFLLDQGFVLADKCLQPKQGTGSIEIANQGTIRQIGAAMYQYGSLWLRRKKHIFDQLG